MARVTLGLNQVKFSIEPSATVNAAIAGIAMVAFYLVSSSFQGFKYHFLESERVDLSEVGEFWVSGLSGG